MTRPARFTSADVRRALRVAETLGLGIAGYEIAPDGTIRILTAQADSANVKVNPLERHLNG
jgi:hypothetical protein